VGVGWGVVAGAPGFPRGRGTRRAGRPHSGAAEEEAGGAVEREGRALVRRGRPPEPEEHGDGRRVAPRGARGRPAQIPYQDGAVLACPGGQQPAVGREAQVPDAATVSRERRHDAAPPPQVQQLYPAVEGPARRQAAAIGAHSERRRPRPLRPLQHGGARAVHVELECRPRASRQQLRAVGGERHALHVVNGVARHPRRVRGHALRQERGAGGGAACSVDRVGWARQGASKAVLGPLAASPWARANLPAT